MTTKKKFQKSKTDIQNYRFREMSSCNFFFVQIQLFIREISNKTFQKSKLIFIVTSFMTKKSKFQKSKTKLRNYRIRGTSSCNFLVQI